MHRRHGERLPGRVHLCERDSMPRVVRIERGLSAVQYLLFESWGLGNLRTDARARLDVHRSGSVLERPMRGLRHGSLLHCRVQSGRGHLWCDRLLGHRRLRLSVGGYALWRRSDVQRIHPDGRVELQRQRVLCRRLQRSVPGPLQLCIVECVRKQLRYERSCGRSQLPEWLRVRLDRGVRATRGDWKRLQP